MVTLEAEIALEYGQYAIIKTTLNVRSGPGSNYQRIGQVLQGDSYDILGRNADSSWLLIDVSGVEGWISAQYTTVQGDLQRVSVSMIEVKQPDAYKAIATEIPVRELHRNTEKYEGTMVTYTGEVVQVIEEEVGFNTVYTLRLLVSDNIDEIIGAFIIADQDTIRPLDRDIMTVWGVVRGRWTYEAVLGNQISIPLIDVKHFELNDPLGSTNIVATVTPAPTPIVDTSLPTINCTNPHVQIDSPTPRSRFTRRQVIISGNADIPNFNYYKIEYSTDPSGNVWNYLLQQGSPVTSGKLMELDTSTVPNGPYGVRLTVIDQTGNYPEPCEVWYQIE
ncbi:MAG: SH3 domain-containing protein [Chloroflexota bacterium]